jgi:hypothetical protein
MEILVSRTREDQTRRKILLFQMGVNSRPVRGLTGSGPVRLGIEKRKAQCGECRLPWLDTESIVLRLPCAAL